MNWVVGGWMVELQGSKEGGEGCERVTWHLEPIYANVSERKGWERQVSHSGYCTGGDEGT